jgi:CRISPR-associated exonuclease Cas4
MREDDPWLLEVTDLKQWRHCPRIVFYRYCLPRIRPITGKMYEGIAHHDDEQAREERRSLRAYGLQEGERHFNVPLRSPELGLVGKLDLLIITPDRSTANAEGIVVEYKLSDRKPGPHIRLQLAAYALLVETLWNVPVRRAFLYQMPLRTATPIAITAALKAQAHTTITAIRTMVEQQTLPDPPTRQAICVSCEFRRFCNDVL